MKTYKIEVFIRAETESEVLERIQDIARKGELDGFGEITEEEDE